MVDRFRLQARLLRRSMRRLRQTLRYGSLSHSPILFANSFPKSGTHLLTQVMQGFAHLGPAADSGLPAIVTFDGFTGRQRPQQEILRDLRRLRPGDIAYGHVHAFPQAVEFLCQPGVVAYFILRDPRDVVVSHVHYIAEMAPNHIHHRYYHQVLHSFDERLKASIVGVPMEELAKSSDKPALEPLPDILSRFAPYLGWLERPEVLTLRYEDFILDRPQTIQRVLEHALARGFPLRRSKDQAASLLEACINPQRSPTFRSGAVGGWRSAFTEEHVQIFEQVAGDLLSQLGYPA